MYNRGRNPRGNRPRPQYKSSYPPTGGNYGANPRMAPRKQGMHPVLLAALIMLIPIVVLRLLNAYVFFDSLWSVYLYPVQLVCYLVSGVLAAKFFASSLHYVRPRNLNDQPVKLGAGAGLTLGILNLVLSIIFVLTMSLTFYGGIFGKVSAVVCGPLDVFLALLLGALGGKLFDNSWR